MEKLGLNEIREKYLSFFQSKGHLRLESFPLVPQHDPSLLLIPAGMAPLKPYFMGELTPPAPRVTTCQKCIRTNDIENVGQTARHLTFFEMLGNFSFGDYFKPQATRWAWEFVTEVLKMPKDRLYVSIYEDDDEAGRIWTQEVGVDPGHVFKMGREDNFWEIGTGTGPCGPCSEIYFDRGEKYACGPDCHPGCDCDRFVEFWNLVFTQYNNDGNGNYTELAHKNIDTGMGLERIACIMQQVDSLFEIDTMVAITNAVSALCGIKVGASTKTDVSLRIITDHIRSTVMLICDGVIPSNEGRGYVLRRLIRRAARHGRLLGIEGEFLTDLSDKVFEVSGNAYPQILEKRDYIKQVIRMEEQRFAKTIDSGIARLGELMNALEAEGKTVLNGEDAFRLYDTYGFPVDLTIEILAERNMTLDRAVFDEQMEAQRNRARSARQSQGGLGWATSGEDFGADIRCEFVGYDHDQIETKLTAISCDGEMVGEIHAPAKAVLILEKTSFYAESGGQVADTGVIFNDNARFTVENVQKLPDGKILHSGALEEGAVSVSDKVTASIDTARRAALRRAHSSVHLLQAALREVLGSHVEQAGSLVEPDRARFDFTHFSGLSAEELARVEAIVNDKILEGIAGHTDEMPIDEAKKLGAMALFGEKYGDIVRVVRFGDYSVELCGGTHLDNTAKVGLFKITAESSVAAGVRRIEALTGTAVLDYLAEKQALIRTAAQTLKTTEHDLALRAQGVMDEIRELGRELEKLHAAQAQTAAQALTAQAEEIGGVKLIAKAIDGADAAALRGITDSLRDTDASIAAVLAGVCDGKVVFVACAGRDAVARGAHAGNLLKTAAKICGGGGGGRPDSASAGGRDASKLSDALAAMPDALRAMLK
jgi:alanyl-tRNA synthetase